MNSLNLSQNNSVVIYSFWQDIDDKPMPAYLQLCLDTWHKFIPNLKLQIINYDNWEQYVGSVYDLDKLKTFSLPMQSDAVTAAVLSTYGGTFFDIDTVIIGDISEFLDLCPRKLIQFGEPNTCKSGHLGVIKCNIPNNPLINAWKNECHYRILNKPEKIDWSYLGNHILDVLEKKSCQFINDYLIIDRIAWGAILESCVMQETDNRKMDYINLFFNEYIKIDVQKALQNVKYGLFMLHNSWTPEEYKQIIDKEEFLNTRCVMADIFRYLLA